MKPLLFGIAALLVGFPSHSQTASVESEAIQVLSETASVQSGTIYLVLRYGAIFIPAVSMIHIPMESIEQCNIAGATLKSSKRFRFNDKSIGFECIEGK